VGYRSLPPGIARITRTRYRELARLALATDAGACRCGAVKAPCPGCRVASWLAVGLLAPGPEKRPFPSTYLDWRHQ
jgi:hypothetical protein